MDRGAWQAVVHGVKELDMTERLHVTSLENSEESEIKLPTSAGSEKKQENSRKTSTSASLATLKPLTVNHNKLWDRNTRPPYLPPEKPVCRSRSNS